MKKFISFFTIVCILLCMTSCVKKGNYSVPTDLTSKVNNKITLTYWAINMSDSQDIKNYNDISMYKQMEKDTGIHINFIHPSRDNEYNDYKKMICSNSLPDIIEFDWRAYDGGAEKALSDGKIIDLSKWIPKFAPNLNAILSQNESVKKKIMTQDGKCYAFPFVNLDKYPKVGYGPCIRNDWLKKLNLSIPKTLDDWHNVLTSFKNNAPSNNGKVIPLNFGSLDDFISSNAFAGSWGLSNFVYVDNGKVKCGCTEPQYKEMLATLNQWYKEGLIEARFTRDPETSMINTGIIWCSKDEMLEYDTVWKKKDANYQLLGIPYPEVKNGQKILGPLNYGRYNGVAAISTSNKHVQESVKWLDYAYSDKGQKLFNYGVEGSSYNNDSNGNPVFSENIKKYKGYDAVNQLKKYIRPYEWGGPYILKGDSVKQYDSILSPDIVTSVNNWSNADVIDLGYPLTGDEEKKISSLTSDYCTTVKDMVEDFTSGDEPLDDFDKYVQKIKSSCIDQFVQTYQEAYDRFIKQ